MTKYLNYILITLLMLCAIPKLQAQSTDSMQQAPLPGDSIANTRSAREHQRLAELAFERKDYAEAVRHYEHVLSAKPNPTAYYNIALCYGKMEKLSESILAYERALLLEPTMREARHNLRIAYATTRDGLSDGRSLAFIDKVCYALSIESFGWIALALFTLMLIGILAFRLGESINTRRIGFYSAIIFALLWLIALAMVAHQYYYHKLGETRAIVQTKQDLFPTPTGGNSLITLHEGTAVFVQGEAQGAMQEVSLADGRSGWVAVTSIVRVVPDALQE